MHAHAVVTRFSFPLPQASLHGDEARLYHTPIVIDASVDSHASVGMHAHMCSSLLLSYILDKEKNICIKDAISWMTVATITC